MTDTKNNFLELNSILNKRPYQIDSRDIEGEYPGELKINL